MSEGYKEAYFVWIRIGILLLIGVYQAYLQFIQTGASVGMLLSFALFFSVVIVRELFDRRMQWLLLAAAGILLLIMQYQQGISVLYLWIIWCYEVLNGRDWSKWWYLLPLGIGLAADSQKLTGVLCAALIGGIYGQHNFVVMSYQRQEREEILEQQRLKRSMNFREQKLQEEVNKGLLEAEKQILEERMELSQTLHDKLGHSINGSVYQLEAVKVLMEKEPETARRMIQAVIDQLRGGMDEIRMILRKKRPERYRIAIWQLEKLCDECREKGVEAELVTEGALEEIPEKLLEILLDNAYEAVSNSLKYSGCSRIKICVRVFHQMIRCSISDNGVGCSEIVDGMGISGMRKRMREVKGILDFETQAGFTINMLLPYQKKERER